MGLAETGIAVDEKRIESFPGKLRHGNGRCVCKLVRRANDEIGKGIARDYRKTVSTFLGGFRPLVIIIRIQQNDSNVVAGK